MNKIKALRQNSKILEKIRTADLSSPLGEVKYWIYHFSSDQKCGRKNDLIAHKVAYQQQKVQIIPASIQIEYVILNLKHSVLV